MAAQFGDHHEDYNDVEMSDSEEWYSFAMDDDEEKRSKRSKGSLFHLYEIASSTAMDHDDDAVSAKKLEEVLSIPPSVRKIPAMEIKDAVKENVLPLLPAKVLTRFRSVSKSWDSQIKSPFLAHQQSYSFQDISGFFCQSNYSSATFLSLDHAAYGVPSPSLTFLRSDIDIIASSHGLLACQARDGNNSYYICNPANKNWKELPKPGYYHGLDSGYILAFDPCVLNMEADYQLVCAVPLIDHPFVLFETYSSETKSWKCSDVICVELGDFRFTGNGFYMKGVAFWKTSTGKVLAFDVKSEAYGIMCLPSESPPGGVLGEIHGELCYIGIARTSRNEFVVKMYYGVDMRLRQRIDFNIVDEMVPCGGIGGYQVLPYFRGDALMVVVGSIVYSYSLRDGRVHEVISSSKGVDDAFSCSTRCLPYVNSLVRVV